jgi:PAS domain S-box-containing protein
MPSLLIAIDILEQVTQWNHRATEFSGVSAQEAVGRGLAEVFPFHADLEPLIAKALETAQTQQRQKACWQVGEQRHFVDIIIYPLSGGGLEGVVIRADNVDERVRMEEMMIFTEKMVSVGSLAAGMAHEINNPLAIMIQNAQVLRNRLLEKLPKNAADAEECGIRFEQLQHYLEARNISATLDSILHSGARATKIVEDMVNFAQRRVSCYSPCHLAELVKQTLELAGNDYDLKKRFNFRNIDFDVDVPPELPTLHCETDQIQQVLLNLLRNGAQSMAGDPNQQQPPKFSIRARATDNLLRLEVSDNGPGIDEKIQNRIFDPFFTTRPVGTGTGLGLAATYFIITEKHGGSIRVESEPGKGSRFIIELPLTGSQHG